eukprot:3197471-Pyramimonas_sp.AAC.1
MEALRARGEVTALDLVRVHAGWAEAGYAGYAHEPGFSACGSECRTVDGGEEVNPMCEFEGIIIVSSCLRGRSVMSEAEYNWA